MFLRKQSERVEKEGCLQKSDLGLNTCRSLGKRKDSLEKKGDLGFEPNDSLG